jgi:hypothetical protein
MNTAPSVKKLPPCRGEKEWSSRDFVRLAVVLIVNSGPLVCPQKRKNRTKIDELVKSQKSRHSREGGSPELLDSTGFPLSRE